MANRTMIIAANRVPIDLSDAGLKTIGLSEFAYDIPLIYRVLVSAKPRLCHSTIFESQDQLAIAGDAKAGLKKLVKIRKKLPKKAQNAQLIDDVIAFLSKAHHDYPYYVLEPAEVYSMSGDPLGPQMTSLLQDIKKLNMREVQKAASGPQNYRDWATDCWTNVLYFVPRGAVKPPLDLQKMFLSLTTKEVVENADAISKADALTNLDLITVKDDTDIAEAFSILARSPSAFHLKISGQSETLPETIGELRGITGLSILDADLKEIPFGLQRLKQLKKLIVARTQIAEIPDFIREMGQLEDITVSENNLSKLPDWIGELENLEMLNLMDNPIAELPDTLWQAPALRRLVLSNTKLQAISEDLGRLQSLQGLSVANLGLSDLPDSIWSLSELVGLTLDGNPLGPNLPEEKLRQLKKLKHFNFRSCGLEVFPQALCDMPDLVRIDARKNEISTVPKCLREKPLDWIGLQGNPHPYKREDFNSKAIGV